MNTNTNIRNEKVSVRYSGNKLVVQNAKIKLEMSVSTSDLNLIAAGKEQKNLILNGQIG